MLKGLMATFGLVALAFTIVDMIMHDVKLVPCTLIATMISIMFLIIYYGQKILNKIDVSKESN